MAAIAPAADVSQTADDALVQKFVQYVQARPDATTVTLDEIKHSVIASTTQPGGKEYLERMLSQPAPANIVWGSWAGGMSTVTVSITSLEVVFTPSPAILGTAVSKFTAKSSMPQLLGGTYPYVESYFYYNKATDIQPDNKMNVYFWQNPRTNWITLECSIPTGETMYKIMIKPPIIINNVQGDGSWSK